MSDLRIQYNEEMVGANHPTKADTLNRALMGGATPTLRDIDGKVLVDIFKKQTGDPSTGEDEVALFCKDDGSGNPGLHLRKESNGDVLPVAGLPVGAIIISPTGTPFAGTLGCDGSTLSRTTYAALFAEIGETYGAGDGSTTFAIPDFRGVFLRGWDNGAGVDPDAASRTDRGDGTTGDYPGTKQACEVESHSHNLTKYNSGDVLSGNNVRSTNLAGGQVTSIAYGGNETRPVNINVMYCIKY